MSKRCRVEHEGSTLKLFLGMFDSLVPDHTADTQNRLDRLRQIAEINKALMIMEPTDSEYYFLWTGISGMGNLEKTLTWCEAALDTLLIEFPSIERK